MNRIQYTRVQIAAYVVTFAWSIAVLAAGLHISGVLARVLTTLPVALVVAFAVFDTYLWRLKPIRKLIQHPDLGGTWKGTLVSIRDGPDGPDTQYEPIPIVIVIWQTYLTISISLVSAESRSRSIAAVVEKNNHDDFTVYYHYGNVPKISFRTESPIHSGGSCLQVSGLAPTTIDGEYWTDRKTRGSYTVHRASRKHFASWADAIAKLGKPEVEQDELGGMA